MYNLNIGSTYDIELKAPAILGGGYKSAKVLSIAGFDIAKMLSNNLDTLHLTVYNLLTVGTPKNVIELQFVIIKTTTGEKVALAMDWINGQPTLVTNKNVLVDIKSLSPAKIQLLRDFLNSNNFTTYEINILD